MSLTGREAHRDALLHKGFTGRPLDYSPCLECKLCVAAGTVGAIGNNGEFHFSACSTHSYREFMDRVLKPSQHKRENLCVLPNSQARACAEKRFPHKPVKVVDGGRSRPQD